MGILKVKQGISLIALIIWVVSPSVAATEVQIAAKFAPVFHQALGSNPRADYITNFDFDGDWRGDNNWTNLDDPRFRLRAYIYYSVMETETHYFARYAVFHPRDYKGGERRGAIASRMLRQASRAASRFDPTGRLGEATLAHENDLEGALVVARKGGNGLQDARIEYVQTLKHNSFLTYSVDGSNSSFPTVQLEGDAAVLYVQPMGHGIEAFTGSDLQTAGKGFLVYRHTGVAEDADAIKTGDIGYELIPIASTLWPRSDPDHPDKKTMYGRVHYYGSVEMTILAPNGEAIKRSIKVGRRGSSFRGRVGGRDMARPPWGWFDNRRRLDRLGRWYFDPARIVKKTVGAGGAFSTVYTKVPYWAQ
jgi:hypothetical protein